MTLLIANPALRDLDHLFTTIAQHSPARAVRFSLRFRERCERLETFPRVGVRPELGPGLRSFPVRPSSCCIASMEIS
jgi:plasmid stabilization system protein ParE